VEDDQGLQPAVGSGLVLLSPQPTLGPLGLPEALTQPSVGEGLPVLPWAVTVPAPDESPLTTITPPTGAADEPAPTCPPDPLVVAQAAVCTQSPYGVQLTSACALLVRANGAATSPANATAPITLRISPGLPGRCVLKILFVKKRVIPPSLR